MQVVGIIRGAFFQIDMIVYDLIAKLYNLFNMLAETTIFSQEQVKQFSSRIYTLISLIMIFKLAFSFINYIVSPDQITDKQKGGGKLITNVVIVIALLASVPTIFNEAYYLQNILIKEGIVQKLILGSDTKNSDNPTSLLSTYAFLSFFQPTTKIASCVNYGGINDISQECRNALDAKGSAYDKTTPGTVYSETLQEGTLDKIRDGNIVNSMGGGYVAPSSAYQVGEYYLFDYHFLLSTAAGLFICWIILGFCFDIAVRSVKFGFLQLIAPIPIIMSLSPGKKSDGALEKWAKECLSTWLLLFVRVGVISFALYLISMVNSGGGIVSFVSGGTTNNFFVTIFVIIGILLFAKEFPKLLEDLFGLKGAKMTLNPLKKATETPLLGKPFAKGVAGLGAASSFAGNLLKNTAKLATPGGREKFGENMEMARKEASGRFHADITKPYSGDTQAKLVHKRNLEEREAARKASREQRHLEHDVEKGTTPYQTINDRAAKDFKCGIEETGIIDKDGRKSFQDKYVGAYGKSHEEYARNAADLDITKSQGVFLKKQLRQAESALSNATTEAEKVAYAKQVTDLTKNVTDNESQEKAIKETLERIGKNDTGAARIAKQITAAKSAPEQYLSREKPAGTYKEADNSSNPQQEINNNLREATAAMRDLMNEVRNNQTGGASTDSASHDTGIAAPGSSGNYQSDGTIKASNPSPIIGLNNKPINRTRDPKDQ